MKKKSVEQSVREVKKILDDHGLSVEEQRDVLTDMLNEDCTPATLAAVTEKGREFASLKMYDPAKSMLRKKSSVTEDLLGSKAVTGQYMAKADFPKKLASSVFTPEGMARLVAGHEDRIGEMDAEEALQLVTKQQDQLREARKALREASDRLSDMTRLPDTDPEKAALLRQHDELVSVMAHAENTLEEFYAEAPELRTMELDYTPGQRFTTDISAAVATFVKSHRWNIRDLTKARDAMNSFLDKEAASRGATDAQLRYAKNFYNLPLVSLPGSPGNQDLSKLNETRERALCLAWARAVELIPNVHELVADFDRRIGLAVWPPNHFSAANLEALCMALGYCWGALRLTGNSDEERDYIRTEESRRNIFADLFLQLSAIRPRIASFLQKTKYLNDKEGLAGWSLAWLDANFTKLEVGHKFAAALALTDVPADVEVKAPWLVWSLIIPDGLFDPIIDDSELMGSPQVSYSRCFCVGTDIQYIVMNNGYVMGPLSTDKMLNDPHDEGEVGKMLVSLVRGACLALSNPDDYKKKKVGSSSYTTKKREGGAPDLANARYLLTAPVKVDLRDVVRMQQRGETSKGRKLTVQFLVRGHWKNQAHGPKHSLRKNIWIHPFWKGPEESRVLLRNYTVKDKDQDV